ncbi:putative uncharacterized protein DDB_G0282133 [Daktulosphaira vitifoliae]|uniref:putative uncharacterized protein DDB_G0282133 n=1 Tax=Daktulosphaira vitifoliae TaxID=58002 RepID=UPI0021AA389B|nr:putative uncharacterized protein DDB_G0282133 [Daktulosphaira vitifoliae]
MFRLIVFLILFAAVFANFYGHMKLHCLFSKYMLNFFQLNEKYFILSSNLNVPNVTYMNHLKYYGNNIQTQSVIILVMLDELQKIDKQFSADLMTVNLYLNNVMGHTYMYSNNENTYNNTYLTDEQHLRIGFKINYDLITTHLQRFLDHECDNTNLFFIQVEKRFEYLTISQRGCLNINKIDDVQVAYNCLEGLKKTANGVFEQNILKIRYVDFHPSNLLFFDIMNSYSKFHSTYKAPDGLSLMRSVTVQVNYNTETTILKLYESALLNFDGYYMKSFQQQFLAATIHPVFMLIISFLNTYKQLYSTQFDRTFRAHITNLTNSIVKIIQNITRTELYDFKINKLYSDLAHNLSSFNLYNSKPNWINNAITTMTQAMSINKLKLNLKVYQLKNYITYQECLNLLRTIDGELNIVDTYVNALIQNKKSFHIIRKTVSHNDLFEVEPLNILNVKSTENLSHYDKNLLFSKPVSIIDVKKEANNSINNTKFNQTELVSQNSNKLNSMYNKFLNNSVETNNIPSKNKPITANISVIDLGKKEGKKIGENSSTNQAVNVNLSNSLLNSSDTNNSERYTSQNVNNKPTTTNISITDMNKKDNSDLNETGSINRTESIIISNNSLMNSNTNNILDYISDASSHKITNFSVNDINNKDNSDLNEHDEIDRSRSIDSSLNSTLTSSNTNNNLDYISDDSSNKITNVSINDINNKDNSDLNEHDEIDRSRSIDSSLNSAQTSSNTNNNLDYISDDSSNKITNVSINYINSNDNSDLNEHDEFDRSKSIDFSLNSTLTRCDTNNNLGYISDDSSNKITNVSINDINSNDNSDLNEHDEFDLSRSMDFSCNSMNLSSSSILTIFDSDNDLDYISDGSSNKITNICLTNMNKKENNELNENGTNNQVENINFASSSLINTDRTNKAELNRNNSLIKLKATSINDIDKDKKGKNSFENNRSSNSNKSVNLINSNNQNNIVLHEKVDENLKVKNEPNNNNNSVKIKSEYNSENKEIEFATDCSSSSNPNKNDEGDYQIGILKFNELKSNIEKRILDNSIGNNINIANETQDIPSNNNIKKVGSRVSQLLNIYNDLAENKIKNQKEDLNSRSNRIKNQFILTNNTSRREPTIKVNKSDAANHKSNDENFTLLHCVFSKFMLQFLQLNEQRFVAVHYKNNIETFTLENLIYYNSNLQSQSKNILAMLDELRSLKSNVFVPDLMTVNLYINNLKGNINENSTVDGYVKLSRDKFILYYNIMTEELSQYINSKCRNCLMGKIDKRFTDLKEIVYKMSDNHMATLSTKKLMEDIQILKYQSFVAFKETLENDSYNDFHPTNMLFYDLMSGWAYPKNSKANSLNPVISNNSSIDFKQKNNGLNLIRKVILTTNNDAEIKSTVVELFYCVSLNYKAEFIKSYQQQVLASTIHPVFKSISNYLIVFKQIFYAQFISIKFTEDITKIGILLKDIFKKFVDLNLFADKPNEYLINVLKKFEEIIYMEPKSSIKTEHPELISSLLRMCSKPMILNNLEFTIADKISTNLSDEIYKKIISESNREVSNINNFVNSLSSYKCIFEIIKRTVPHEELFTIKPLEIIQECEIEPFSNLNSVNED